MGAVEGKVLGLDTAPQSLPKGQEETGTQLLPPESVSPAENPGLVSRLCPARAAAAETDVGQMLDAELVWPAAGKGSTEEAAVAGRVSQGNDSSPKGTIVLGDEKVPVVNTRARTAEPFYLFH